MADCFGKGLFSQLEEEEEEQQQRQSEQGTGMGMGVEDRELMKMNGMGDEQFVQEQVVDDLDEEAIPIQTLEL